MITKWMKQTMSMVVCSTLMIAGAPTEFLQAQNASQPAPASQGSSTPPAVAPLTSSQLDALVAPIALYPDALVAQVLAAASYADEVAFADDWVAQNQNLQGNALTQAVNQQSWDPSVKALTQFPSVLHNLAKNLSWTSSLGQAFENQQSDVMAAVQFMRAQAQAAGTLQSSPQIKVVQQSPQTIVIEPASSNVVYVPQYNPAVVYGTPLVVPAYTPPVAVAAGVSFGAGVAIGAAFGGGGFIGGGFGGGWGFGAWGMNWGGGGGGGTINYNHNTYITRNNITRNSNNNNNNGNRNNNNGNRSFSNGNRYNNTNEVNNRNNGNRPDVPNGGRNGDHGLIGGNGGVQHQVGDSERPGRLGSGQPRSTMSSNGNQARAESNRGRASIRPAAYQRQRQGQQRQGQQRQQHFQQPRQQHGGGGGERGGGRR
ncbi:MAG TPA: DUF3300 domain-containing protein [Acidobacteriaceae bacterium]|jgi:hypothetical protein|nr:DUF3300 domain-containing protein [Acidobacteriaceae bacterium]